MTEDQIANDLDAKAMGKGWVFRQESTQGVVPVKVYYEHRTGKRVTAEGQTKTEAKILAAKLAIDTEV